MYENESMTLPSELLKQCLTDVFIETGSYDGRTIQQALDCGFDEVRSVELSRAYYNICSLRFRNNPKVRLYFGDTCDTMPAMIADLSTPATFWLDAHIQEGIAGKYPAPLLYDLGTISKSLIKNHIIIIDDRRLMGNGWWKDTNEDAVMAALYAINEDYVIEFHDSKAATKDIIVAHV